MVTSCRLAAPLKFAVGAKLRPLSAVLMLAMLDSHWVEMKACEKAVQWVVSMAVLLAVQMVHVSAVVSAALRVS